MIEKYYILIIIACFTACTPKNIFQYGIRQTGEFPTTNQITGKKLEITAEGILAFYLVDSLIIVHQRGVDKYISIYGKQSFKKLKELLPKGRGPQEFLDFTFQGQHITDTNGTEIYFSDTNKGSLYALNLTQSLKHDSLYVTRISKLPYRSFPTFLTDSNYISKTYIPEKKEFSFILHDTNARPIRTYPLYQNINFSRYNQIASADQIKPDLSKIAMGMLSFNQINILDLKENRNFSITTSGTTTWLSEKYLEEHDYNIYYCALKCTNEKIYALYTEQKISEWQRIKKPVEIHVFDWEGTPLYKLKIKENSLVSLKIN